MQKISSTESASLLKTAGATIRNLVTENQELRQKLAAKEKDERIDKIARDMEEKGLLGETSLDDVKAKLASEATNLDVTEEAVKMAAPQGGFFGSADDIPGNGNTAFEHFIMTGEAE